MLSDLAKSFIINFNICLNNYTVYMKYVTIVHMLFFTEEVLGGQCNFVPSTTHAKDTPNTSVRKCG